MMRWLEQVVALLRGRPTPPVPGPTCPVCSQAVDTGQPVAMGVDGRLYHPGCVE